MAGFWVTPKARRADRRKTELFNYLQIGGARSNSNVIELYNSHFNKVGIRFNSFDYMRRKRCLSVVFKSFATRCLGQLGPRRTACTRGKRS